MMPLHGRGTRTHKAGISCPHGAGRLGTTAPVVHARVLGWTTGAVVSPVVVGPVQGPEDLSRRRSTTTGESSRHCRAAVRRARMPGPVRDGKGRGA